MRAERRKERSGRSGHGDDTVDRYERITDDVRCATLVPPRFRKNVASAFARTSVSVQYNQEDNSAQVQETTLLFSDFPIVPRSEL
jgi:hypothetical protein